jgi:hypothetical protein
LLVSIENYFISMLAVAGGADADTGPVAATGEDSDYYTPEDPATTILSPLHTDKVGDYI